MRFPDLDSHVSNPTTEPFKTASAYAGADLFLFGCYFFSKARGLHEVTVDTATDKFVMSAGSFGAELEREKARQRTYDVMQRKAKAGHVTGGRVFG